MECWLSLQSGDETISSAQVREPARLRAPLFVLRFWA